MRRCSQPPPNDLAFMRDWGFKPTAIAVPVTVWQGHEDRMVPLAHGRWLAQNIPGARAEFLEGEGHLSLALAAYDRLLEDLLSR
jgi:pimeloyl-ACP methyl ester carboxylesterase